MHEVKAYDIAPNHEFDPAYWHEPVPSGAAPSSGLIYPVEGLKRLVGAGLVNQFERDVLDSPPLFETLPNGYRFLPANFAPGTIVRFDLEQSVSPAKKSTSKPTLDRLAEQRRATIRWFHLQQDETLYTRMDGYGLIMNDGSGTPRLFFYSYASESDTRKTNPNEVKFQNRDQIVGQATASFTGWPGGGEAVERLLKAEVCTAYVDEIEELRKVIGATWRGRLARIDPAN